MSQTRARSSTFNSSIFYVVHTLTLARATHTHAHTHTHKYTDTNPPAGNGGGLRAVRLLSATIADGERRRSGRDGGVRGELSPRPNFRANGIVFKPPCTESGNKIDARTAVQPTRSRRRPLALRAR